MARLIFKGRGRNNKEIPMTDPQIIEYVETSLSQGVPADQVKNALVEQGWSEIDIDEAINSYYQRNPASQSQGQPVQGGKKQQDIGGMLQNIMKASDMQYTVYYMYKVLLEVAVFSIASVLLVFVGLPWFIPLIAIGVMTMVAVLQINKVKAKSQKTESILS
jgi:hypothetical protein